MYYLEQIYPACSYLFDLRATLLLPGSLSCESGPCSVISSAMAAGWSVRLRCCRLQLLALPPTSPPEPWRISIPPTFHRLIGCVSINEASMTKRLITPIKSTSSLHAPAPPCNCCQLLTACCRHRASLPVGNYPSVFLCFITSSLPPQDVQRKRGI